MAKITALSGEITSMIPTVRAGEDGNFYVDYEQDDPFAGSRGVRGAGVAGLGDYSAEDVAEMMNSMKNNFGFQFNPEAVTGGQFQASPDSLRSNFANGNIQMSTGAYGGAVPKVSGYSGGSGGGGGAPTGGTGGFASDPRQGSADASRDGIGAGDARQGEYAGYIDRYSPLGGYTGYNDPLSDDPLSYQSVVEQALGVFGYQNPVLGLMTATEGLVESGLVSPYGVYSFPGDMGYDNIGMTSELGKIANAMGWEEISTFGQTFANLVGYGPSNWTESAFAAYAEQYGVKHPDDPTSETGGYDVSTGGGSSYGGGESATGGYNEGGATTGGTGYSGGTAQSGPRGAQEREGRDGDGGDGGNACFGQYSLFKMADGTIKPAYEIKVGDTVEMGGRVTLVAQGDGLIEDWYIINGLEITGEHAVMGEDGVWRRAKDDPRAQPIEKQEVLYTFFTENHRLVSYHDVIVTDFTEVPMDHPVQTELYENLLDVLNSNA